MACFLNLNQLDRDGTSSPIVVNLDRVLSYSTSCEI
jgi:hypothetical protein